MTETETRTESWAATLHQIFERQRELMREYKKIEELPDPPVSLHTQHGQKIIRDFAWRATEELTEAYQSGFSFKTRNDAIVTDGMLEELADAHHFMVELLIFAGVAPGHCALVAIDAWSESKADENLDTMFWCAVYALGTAVNHLKNKGWKRTQVPTDEQAFRAAILEAYGAQLQIWSWLGCSRDEIYRQYMRKSEINAERQAGGY